MREAIKEYKQAVRRDFKFFEAHYHLGMANTRLEDSNGAISEFEKAIRLNSRSGKSCFLLGVNLIGTGSGKREEES